MSHFMTKARKNKVASEVLFWLLDKDPNLAIQIAERAYNVVNDSKSKVAWQEVIDLLNPWLPKKKMLPPA